MSFTIKKEHVPLKQDTDGVLRVGGTRVTLDTVIAAFQEGATAEEIVQRYPTLKLADVYSVLSYYLRQQEEIDVYLRHRQHEAQRLRQQNQSLFDLHGIRDRLLARHAKTG